MLYQDANGNIYDGCEMWILGIASPRLTSLYGGLYEGECSFSISEAHCKLGEGIAESFQRGLEDGAKDPFIKYQDGKFVVDWERVPKWAKGESL